MQDPNKMGIVYHRFSKLTKFQVENFAQQKLHIGLKAVTSNCLNSHHNNMMNEGCNVKH